MTHARGAVWAIVGSALVLSSGARADDPAAVTPPSAAASPAPSVVSEERTPEAPGPSLVMLGAGLVSFGNAYAIAAIVGATSSDSSDGRLFIPVVGPWVDLAGRATCAPPGAPSCHDERMNRASLVVDGVFQGIGALAVVAALAFRWPHPAGSARTTNGPKLELSPVQYAHGGAGMAVLGTF